MPEVAEKLKTNLRDRVSAITIIPDNAVSMLTAVIDDLKALKPAQAILDIPDYAVEGTIKFARRQAEITRRWMG